VVYSKSMGVPPTRALSKGTLQLMVWGLGLRVYELAFRVYGLGFRVLGFRV
jgi:hypothetical protein